MSLISTSFQSQYTRSWDILQLRDKQKTTARNLKFSSWNFLHGIFRHMIRRRVYFGEYLLREKMKFERIVISLTFHQEWSEERTPPPTYTVHKVNSNRNIFNVSCLFFILLLLLYLFVHKWWIAFMERTISKKTKYNLMQWWRNVCTF